MWALVYSGKKREMQLFFNPLQQYPLLLETMERRDYWSNNYFPNKGKQKTNRIIIYLAPLNCGDNSKPKHKIQNRDLIDFPTYGKPNEVTFKILYRNIAIFCVLIFS